MSPEEKAQRERVIACAMEWEHTPYRSNGMVKGAGVDCAMLLVAAYADAGIIPPEFDPRPYPPQWHVHRDAERYISFVLQFAHEVTVPLPGDVAMFKIARTFAHGAIVVDWPRVVHARAPSPVYVEDIMQNSTGKHCLAKTEKKFFSFWKQAE